MRSVKTEGANGVRGREWSGLTRGMVGDLLL